VANVETPDSVSPVPAISRLREYAVHIVLLGLTFLTTTLAGVQWLNRDPAELAYFTSGITYAVLLLLMLGSHELGHYFAARHHKISATLPYFLPFPSMWGLVPFGTLGAVIRIRSTIPSRKVMFDIGAAGPISGFIVSVAILIIGFRTLPPIEYLYQIHPEYAHLSAIPEAGLTFGKTLFYRIFSSAFAPAGSFVPPMNEIYHYPFLCVGWFGMLVTAMNLLPISQLDGGHISYAMFGLLYHRIAQVALVMLVALGSLGFLPLLGIPFEFGWAGWLMWALLLILFMRGTRGRRPPIQDESPLSGGRIALGWFCFLIFVGSFSLAPFTIELR
jgi:membrane-associated protease RseP (regulator of RpoE activity)